MKRKAIMILALGAMLFIAPACKSGEPVCKNGAPTCKNGEPACKSGEKPMHRKLNGTKIINTTSLAPEVKGYKGAVPVEISIRKGKVLSVRALENVETPRYFEKAQVLLDKWNGLSVDEAAALEVDAVTGATYSSNAIIGNVRKGLEYYQSKKRR